MAIFKCTDCGGNVNTEANACPHCGAKKPFKKQKLTAEQSKGIPYKEIKAFTNLGGEVEMQKWQKIALWSVLAIIIFFAFKPSKPLTQEELAAKQAADEKSKIEAKAFELTSMCQIKIKHNLNDPDSAEFGKYQILPLGKDTYKIVYEVRAKNAFGAKIKGAFQCKESYDGTKATVLNVKQLH